MPHLLAISTYGSERVRDANSGTTVSAYKFGYSGAESAVLVALYGQRARKIAVTRASYHYVALDKDAPKAVHGGYFLFDLTDDELARSEAITRRFPHDSSVYCYRWMNGAWHDLPTGKRDYKPIEHLYLAISRIKPGDYRPARLDESDTTSANTDGLILTREGDWWWISGDTYPHRELLKRWGCRWGKKRQAWYYIGMSLPSAVQDLIDGLAATVTPTVTATAPAPVEPPFAVGDRVEVIHVNPAMAELTVPLGSRGTVVEVKEYNATIGYSYDVDFDGFDGLTWSFHNDLKRIAAVTSPPAVIASTVAPIAVIPTRPQPQFTLGQTVWLDVSLYLNSDNDKLLLKNGTAGTIMARYDLTERKGNEAWWANHSPFGYRVLLAGQTDTHPCFEDMLTGTTPRADGFTRIQRMPIIPGYSAKQVIAGVILDRQEILNYPVYDLNPTPQPMAENPPFPAIPRPYNNGTNVYITVKKVNYETRQPVLIGTHGTIQRQSGEDPQRGALYDIRIDEGIISAWHDEIIVFDNSQPRFKIGDQVAVIKRIDRGIGTVTGVRTKRKPSDVQLYDVQFVNSGGKPAPMGLPFKETDLVEISLIPELNTPVETSPANKVPLQIGDRVREKTLDLGIGTIVAIRGAETSLPLYEVKFSDEKVNWLGNGANLPKVDDGETDDRPRRPQYQIGAEVYLTQKVFTDPNRSPLDGGIPATVTARYDLNGWDQTSEWGYLIQLKERAETLYVFDHQITHRKTTLERKYYNTEIAVFSQSEQAKASIRARITHRTAIGDQLNIDQKAPDTAPIATEHPSQQAVIVAQQADAMSSLLAMAGMSEADEVIPTPSVEPPKIVITQPNLNPDDPVVQAIERVGTMTLKPYQAPKVQVSGIRIPQQPCGELTGSISGGIHCYGYAIHAGVCLYLNFGGPRTGVEAIRAKLGKGQAVSCIPDEAEAIELTAGEGNTGKYTPYFALMPEVKFTHLILVHEKVLNPNTSGEGIVPYAFVIEASPEQAQAQVWQHVRELVKITVFVQWIPYLWEAGIQAHLIQLTRSAGGITVWAIQMNRMAWTQVITAGLANRLIGLTLNPV
jgi:hypothetical protein